MLNIHIILGYFVRLINVKQKNTKGSLTRLSPEAFL